MSFYFDAFEHRTPPAPIRYSPRRELLWQYLAVICLALGGWYIAWRWSSSLNYRALWYSVPLAVAETGAYIGLVLFTINLWKTRDRPVTPAPKGINECLAEPLVRNRPISVSIFITTYNEDPELVRLSIRDALRVRYPHRIKLRTYVLDDGGREAMRAVAAQEGVGYLTRDSNAGFKAGNLRNALERTGGDFIVICDADTRLFPTFLERTLGYFRDAKMAWVQTPQWFFDLPQGQTLTEALGARLGRPGRLAGKLIERMFGEMRIGEDPFVNDPQMFYDVILRRRNWANAAFCCGAASVHRREAVMEAALRSFAADVERNATATLKQWRKFSGEKGSTELLGESIRSEAASAAEFTPYRFHVSEDIYTSLILHGDRERGWKSYFHPHVESKMLSPQDLLAWTVQRFKYAGGSLDIFLRDSALLRPGLTLPQRLMYASTLWSYLGGLWNLIFLIAPMVYFATGIAPVEAYSIEFAIHILPFLLMTEVAFMVGTWGVPGYRSKASYLSFFAVNLRAIWTVLRGKKIGFTVTPKELQSDRHPKLVIPQIAVILLTVGTAAYALIATQLGISHHSPAGLLSNLCWGSVNVLALAGIVRAALRKPGAVEAPAYVETPRVASTNRAAPAQSLSERLAELAMRLGLAVDAREPSLGKLQCHLRWRADTCFVLLASRNGLSRAPPSCSRRLPQRWAFSDRTEMTRSAQIPIRVATVR